MTTESGPASPETNRVDPRIIIRLFDQSPSFLAYLQGPDYRYKYVNAAFTKIIGGRDVVERPLAEALPDVEANFKPLLDEVRRTGEPMRISGARYDRQVEAGAPVTEHYVDFIYQPILDSDGKVDGILLQGDDVTELVLAERALAEARNTVEAAELVKAEFVSQLNHDIRAPMNAVLSLIDIIAGTQPLSAEQREYLRILRISADSVLTQIGDMVDSARMGSRSIVLENRPFSPAGVLRDAANAIIVPARDKGLTIDVSTEVEDEAQYIGDAGRIRQILTLLCTNALRETDTGQIRLAVKQGEARNLVFEVTGTGAELSQGRLATLFERNPDERYNTYGLGLMLTRALTEMMGGTVYAQSDAGKGTTFTVRLPLAFIDEPTDVQPDRLELTTAKDQGLQPVLVVEDYEPNILIITTYLKQMGYAYEVVGSGRSAVSKASSGHYALALMDVQMPGLNGLEATRMIRKSEAETGRPHLPVVGVTAHSLAVDRQRCLDAGMDDFLPKPFNASDLREKIVSVLAEDQS